MINKSIMTLILMVLMEDFKCHYKITFEVYNGICMLLLMPLLSADIVTIINIFFFLFLFPKALLASFLVPFVLFWSRHASF